VAFASGTGIWTLDLERKTKTRITFDQRVYQEPAWSADGKMLVFTSLTTNGGGNVEIRYKASDGSGSEKTYNIEQNNYHNPAWSPDGKFLTYLWGDGEKNVSLWMAPVAGGAKAVAAVQPPSAQSNIVSYRVSPDGHWVAYVSDESGQQEVYVTSFPEGRGKWRVSSNSGAYPAWSANGKELFYMSLGNDFFACVVAVKGTEFVADTPQHLFHTATPGVGIVFDASLDGKRLLINHSDEELQSPLHLNTDWLAEVKR
jgi:Tol biopolymer transport system component